MASKPGPGPIAAVHRITIGMALLGALAYAAWEVNQLRVQWSAAGAVRVAAALAATVGIGLYLRSLRGLGDKLTPGLRRPPEP